MPFPSDSDPDLVVENLINDEFDRQISGLQLIASENFTSPAVMRAVGSVLTLTNCIGFALSIVSIELFTSLAQEHQLSSLLPWLGIGPLLGVLAMRPLLGKQFSGRP